MKKKFFAVALASAVTLGAFAWPVIGANREVKAVLSDIKLYINGTKINKEIVIINGSSYIPLRAGAEALNMNINWDQKSATITLTNNEITNTNSVSLPYDKIEVFSYKGHEAILKDDEIYISAADFIKKYSLMGSKQGNKFTIIKDGMTYEIDIKDERQAYVFNEKVFIDYTLLKELVK